MSPGRFPKSTSQPTSEPSGIKAPTAYENIKEVLKSRQKDNSPRQPAVLNEPFQELPPEILFNIDTVASVRVEDENEIPCPDSVEEALFLVSKARQKSATHPSFSADHIAKGVDYNGFDVYSIKNDN